MWLAFPTLFDFGEAGELPETFRPTCHIFYSHRVVDMADGLPKWSGHKNASEQIGDATLGRETEGWGTIAIVATPMLPAHDTLAQDRGDLF